MKEEKRIGDGSTIKDLATGKEFTISYSTETDNQFGYGIYLYNIKGENLALYRKEFEVINEVPEESNTENKKVFELGKYYMHTTGSLLFICGIADSYVYGRTLIGETGTGEFQPIGNNPSNFENWREITRDEFIGDPGKR